MVIDTLSALSHRILFPPDAPSTKAKYNVSWVWFIGMDAVEAFRAEVFRVGVGVRIV